MQQQPRKTGVDQRLSIALLGAALFAVSSDAGAREAMQAYIFPAAMISDTQMSGYGRMRQIPQVDVIDANGVLRRDGFIDRARSTLRCWSGL